MPIWYVRVGVYVDDEETAKGAEAWVEKALRAGYEDCGADWKFDINFMPTLMLRKPGS